MLQIVREVLTALLIVWLVLALIGAFVIGSLISTYIWSHSSVLVQLCVRSWGNLLQRLRTPRRKFPEAQPKDDRTPIDAY